MIEIYVDPEGIGCVACAGCLFPCLICLVDGPIPVADSVGLTAGAKAIFAARVAV